MLYRSFVYAELVRGNDELMLFNLKFDVELIVLVIQCPYTYQPE